MTKRLKLKYNRFTNDLILESVGSKERVEAVFHLAQKSIEESFSSLRTYLDDHYSGRRIELNSSLNRDYQNELERIVTSDPKLRKVKVIY